VFHHDAEEWSQDHSEWRKSAIPDFLCAIQGGRKALCFEVSRPIFMPETAA
jgi:hypothetical protein